MSPRDAFGNEIGEDPLAGLGWKKPGDAQADGTEATPVFVSSAPPGPSSGTGLPDASSTRLQIPGRGRRGIGVGAVVAAVAVAVVISLGVAVVTLVSDAVDAVDDFDVPKITVPTAADPAPAPAPGNPGPPSNPPDGFQRGSLLLRSNLSPALRRLRTRTGGRVRLLRVSARAVDAQLIDSRRRLVNTQVRFDGVVQVFSRTPAPPGLDAFSWARVNSAAPSRIARSAAGQARRPVTQFDYAVLLDAAGLKWSAFLEGGGTGFLASPDGRSVRRNG